MDTQVGIEEWTNEVMMGTYEGQNRERKGDERKSIWEV